jgi:hypothetical protein
VYPVLVPGLLACATILAFDCGVDYQTVRFKLTRTAVVLLNIGLMTFFTSIIFLTFS